MEQQGCNAGGSSPFHEVPDGVGYGGLEAEVELPVPRLVVAPEELAGEEGGYDVVGLLCTSL